MCLQTKEQGSGYIADKIKKAEKRIQAYPFDTEAWSILIRDAQVNIFVNFYVYEHNINSFCLDPAGWVSKPPPSCAEWSHPTGPSVF